jgi:hypothetical protein
LELCRHGRARPRGIACRGRGGRGLFLAGRALGRGCWQLLLAASARFCTAVRVCPVRRRMKEAVENTR